MPSLPLKPRFSSVDYFPNSRLLDNSLLLHLVTINDPRHNLGMRIHMHTRAHILKTSKRAFVLTANVYIELRKETLGA